MTNNMKIFINFAEIKQTLELHKDETLTEHTIKKILDEMSNL